MSSTFFKQLEHHLSAQLPFVAYRKPNGILIKAMLQNEDELYYTKDFSESGFVFSPFKDDSQTVLFPFDKSKSIETDKDIELTVNQINTNFLIESEAKQNHIDLVKKAIEEIKNGSFKKVVLSRVEVQRFSKSETLLLFKKLLATYKTAMVYCWFHPKVGLWLGATPETLLKVENNRFKTMSLAGTQQFKGKEDVIWQSKETKEQQIVTDFIVSSLKSSVTNLNVGEPTTIKAGNLLHLQTKISGLLNPENGLKTIIKKLHPTPAVCGLPKDLTKQFIIENEGYNREFYTGFLGEINIKSSKSRNTNRRNVENNAYSAIKTISELFVNLRCLQIKDNKALIYVGGGITTDSIPKREWEETVAKSKTVKNLL